MTAEEARKKSFEARIPNMQPIYDAIRDAANQGEMHINFPISKQLSWAVTKVIAELESKGYKIVDKENRDKLKISWSNTPPIEIRDDPAINADDWAPR